MKIEEIATSWDRVKVKAMICQPADQPINIESCNRTIRSSNHRVLAGSATEAVACKLQTTYYQRPITYNLQPTTYYPLPTTYYLLPTTYYLRGSSLAEGGHPPA